MDIKIQSKPRPEDQRVYVNIRDPRTGSNGHLTVYGLSVSELRGLITDAVQDRAHDGQPAEAA